MEFSDFLMKQIDLAIGTMVKSGNSVEKIPNANGMVLVRGGTSEAESRKAERGVVVGDFVRDNVAYLVCNK